MNVNEKYNKFLNLFFDIEKQVRKETGALIAPINTAEVEHFVNSFLLKYEYLNNNEAEEFFFFVKAKNFILKKMEIIDPSEKVLGNLTYFKKEKTKTDEKTFDEKNLSKEALEEYIRRTKNHKSSDSNNSKGLGEPEDSENFEM